MFNYGSSPLLTNVTITGNTTSTNGGIMYNRFSSKPKIFNSIILGNNTGIVNENTTNDVPDIQYSLVQGLSATTNGNINATGVNATDVFVDYQSATTGNPTTAGNFSLKYDAVAINSGSNALYNALTNPPTTDLANYPRIFGGTIDLGAYENQCNTAAPTGNATKTFCGTATVANLTASGTSINWYAEATGGTALASTTALTNGTTYYASQTMNSCESATSFAVTVTLNNTAAPTGNALQTFHVSNNPTVADLVANGSGIQWYSNATGGTPLAVNTPLANGNVYYGTQTINGCESTSRLAVTVEITTLGTEEITKENFRVYPNPAVSFVNIESDFKLESVQIFDASGRLIQTKTLRTDKVKLDVSNYLQGIYLLRLNSEKGIKTIKLIKK